MCGRPVVHGRNPIRRVALLIATASTCLLFTAGQSAAVRPNTSINPCILYSDSAKHLKQFAEEVWSPDRWRRGDPPVKTIEAWRLKLHCAPPGWQKKLKQRWRELQGEYFDRRRAELWRRRVTPFYGAGQWWAVPYYIVVCESGARGYVPSGYYGILFTAEVPTWQTWGEPGFAPSPGQASKREQDIVAHRLWVAYGGEPWECA